MDNPNITLDHLFAKAKMSMKNYEDRQKKMKLKAKKKCQTIKYQSSTASAKQPHRSLRRQVSSACDHGKNCISASTATLSDDTPLKQYAITTSSSEAPKGSPIKYPSFASPTFKTSSTSYATSSAANEVESRRQKEKEALAKLKATLKAINSKTKDESASPNFKPLTWAKSSFTLPSSKNGEIANDEESIQTGTKKRKPCTTYQQEDKASFAIATNVNSIETIASMTRPVHSEAISISTSVAASLSLPLPSSSSFPFHYNARSTTRQVNSNQQGTSRTNFFMGRPKWSKEEVAGLVEFADKWITPDVMDSCSKRQRKM